MTVRPSVISWGPTEARSVMKWRCVERCELINTVAGLIIHPVIGSGFCRHRRWTVMPLVNWMPVVNLAWTLTAHSSIQGLTAYVTKLPFHSSWAEIPQFTEIPGMWLAVKRWRDVVSRWQVSIDVIVVWIALARP